MRAINKRQRKQLDQTTTLTNDLIDFLNQWTNERKLMDRWTEEEIHDAVVSAVTLLFGATIGAAHKGQPDDAAQMVQTMSESITKFAAKRTRRGPSSAI